MPTAATASPPPASRAATDISPLATGTPSRDGTGLYPRAVRLANSGSANGRVLASVVTFDGNNGIGAIHESTDSGATFRQVGALPAGTLLWAASAGQDEPNRRMALRIWRSNDIGRTWSYLSSCAVAEGTGGLWEPEFSVAADGALVCHYADETDAAHSQKLVAAYFMSYEI